MTGKKESFIEKMERPYCVIQFFKPHQAMHWMKYLPDICIMKEQNRVLNYQ